MLYRIKKALSLTLAFILLLSSTSTFNSHASDLELTLKTVNSNQKHVFGDKYKDVYESDNWQKLYVLSMFDTITGEEKTIDIPAINGAILDIEDFENSLPDNLILVNCVTLHNENYKHNTKDDTKYETKWVETAFDVGCLVISVAEFNSDPNFWTGLGVVLDGASVALPCVPAVGGRLISAIKTSDKLADSLKYGVDSYSSIKKLTKWKPFQAHHIFEKRFADVLGVSKNNIFSIALKRADHKKITNKVRSKIPYGSNYSLFTKDDIIEITVESYEELYEETGDKLWEFLADFAREGQIVPK